MREEELLCQSNYQSTTKDIIIVVKDQSSYIKKCLESLYANTSNFSVFIWDNGSSLETKELLQSWEQQHDNLYLVRNETNEGFITPNNRLIEVTTAPFIILLNSDTECRVGWSEALIGYLQNHPEIGAVGYEGGLLYKNGMGFSPVSGLYIDYISGCSLAIPRYIYEEFGLFDEENLKFAYCEDADFCLRLKEGGKAIYVLSLELVKHHANVTTRAVLKTLDITQEFISNHEYINKRHKDYMTKKRILLSYPGLEKQIASGEQYKTPKEAIVSITKQFLA